MAQYYDSSNLWDDNPNKTDKYSTIGTILGIGPDALSAANPIAGETVQNNIMRAKNELSTYGEYLKNLQGSNNLEDALKFKNNLHFLDLNLTPDLGYDHNPWANIAKSTVQGASSGSIGGLWGAAGGAATGLLASSATEIGGKEGVDKFLKAMTPVGTFDYRGIDNIGDAFLRLSFDPAGIFTKQNKDEKDELSETYKQLKVKEQEYQNYANNFANMNIDNVIKRNYRNMMTGIKAFGGYIGGYGGDWSNGLNFVNAGGTHSENPIGGVPMGVSQDGIPNLVEEGEVVWNDYVFSNRIKVPNSVREQYNLKGKDNMTFAEAVKRAQEASAERPNDPIEQRGLDALLTNLMQEQEIIRNKKAEREQHAQSEDLAAMFADGGPIHIAKNKRGTFTAAATKHGMGVQEFAGHVLANKDKFSPAMVKKANFARNASKWHHALGGYLFDNGGHFDEYGNWIPDTDGFDFQSTMVHDLDATRTPGAPWNIDPLNTDRAKVVYSVGNPTGAAAASRVNSKTGTQRLLPTSGWQSSLRYFPAVGPAVGLGYTLLNRPDYEYAKELESAAENYGTQFANSIPHVSYTPLGDYLAYKPFDRLFYANELGAQQAATRSAIMNQSNGNAGQAMAALLAAGYNANRELGNLYRQGEEFNLAQRQQVAAFNRATNQYNSEADLKSQITNAELDRAKAEMLLRTRMDAKAKALGMRQAEDLAWNESLAANLTGLFDNLGAVGEDFANRYDRNALINAGVFGTLSQKPYGVSDEAWENYVNASKALYGKCGGKLNRKRKRGLTI